MLTIIILCLVALVGGILSRKNIAPVTLRDALQRYVYYFAAPGAIIYALGNHDFRHSTQFIKFLSVNIVSYLVLFFVVYIVLKIKRVPRKLAGVVAFSSNTPNTVFLGFPLVLVLFGQEAFVYVALLGTLSDALLSAVRLYMLHKYSVSRLHSRKHHKVNLGVIIKDIFVNPFFVALLIGVALSIFRVTLPSGLQLVGLSASYAALLALGLSVGHLKIKKSEYDEVILTSFIKLIVLPAFILLPTYFLLDTTARNVSVFVAALPTAVLSLIVAHNLKFNERLASGVILATTILSVVSLSCWYILLRFILV